MKALAIADSASDGYTSHCVLIPDMSEKMPKHEFSLLTQGESSALGNKSVTHEKLRLDLIPLAKKYRVAPYSSPDHLFMAWTTSGLPRGRWSAILTPVHRKLTYTINWSYKRREHYVTVEMGPGVCRVSTETLDIRSRDSYVMENDLNVMVYEQRIPGEPIVSRVQRYQRWVNGKLIRDDTWPSEKNPAVPSCRVYVVDVDLAVVPSPDINMLRDLRNRTMSYSEKFLPLKTFNEIAHDATLHGDKAYQTSSFMYLMKLKSLSNLLEPYTRLIKGGMNAKTAADAWLSYYYGARLTAKQTYAQLAGIVRESGKKITDTSVLRSIDHRQSVSPLGVKLSGYRACSIYYRTHCDWLVQTYRTLRRYGLNPSLSLAWDIIPYSFVVDWIAPIGSMLASFDNSTFVQSLEVRESLLGEKLTWQSEAEQAGLYGFVGEVYYSYYSRRILHGHMPKPSFKPVPSDFSGIRLINGVSLVVQRQK